MENIEVKILGLDPKYFQMFPEVQQPENMVGRSLSSPGGDKSFLEFDGQVYSLFENAESYLGKYSVKTSYDSIMQFSDTVCINPSLYQVYDGGCQSDKSKSYSGQGAPLAVTKIDQVITPGTGPEVEFRIFIKNRGVGKIKELSFENPKLGAEGLLCSFQRSTLEDNFVLLDEKKQEALLICRKPFLTQTSSFATTLHVDFKYDYEHKIFQTLHLVK